MTHTDDSTCSLHVRFHRGGRGLDPPEKTGERSAVGYVSGNRCESGDPGVMSLILAPSHTFVEIDH